VGNTFIIIDSKTKRKIQWSKFSGKEQVPLDSDTLSLQFQIINPSLIYILPC